MVEESVLDFSVVCHHLLPFVNKMVIDERKKYILTNYQQTKSGRKSKDSDHFTEFIDLDIKLRSEKPERIEIFDFKDEESLKKFRKSTSETEEFMDCFKDDAPLDLQVNRWRKVLNSHCNKVFKKIRIRKKKLKPIKSKISAFIDERNILSKYPERNEDKINELNEQIAENIAEENKELIVRNFKHFSDNPQNINMQQMWKLLKKLWPKNPPTIPTAKRNHRGKIISCPTGIKKILSKEYKHRLRARPVRPDLESMKMRKKLIFKMKMKLANSSESAMWTMRDLDRALSGLKNNKSRDVDGYVNEIFKKNVIGDNLKSSLLEMFNKLKKNKMIPLFFNFTNITTLHKKGSRIEPRNERGIFGVSRVRAIMMRMIYNMKYDTIDRNMSDCQMGGRRKKGCKNNIFIINGIIQDVLRSKKNKAIVLQIYDYAQMFDSICLEQALSDIYDAGVNDDTLTLLHQANTEIHMSVKTPNGLTDRQIIKDIVLQGDTFGSILASVQVETIGKACIDEGHGYLYKGILPVGFLGLVDDIIGVTEAGIKAQQMNAFINVKTAEKTLQFGPTKCKSMLVGKDTENLINSDLLVDSWSVDFKENIETGEDDLIENYQGLVPIGKTEEQKYLGFIISNKGDNMANIREIKKKSIGTIRKIINKLNSLHLRQYYFECSIILMNSMLRGSILYASDMYYNLKETELRQIERIEEEFLRKVLKTTKGCPITQMYLEMGQYPARFEVQRMRCFYLKYILNQEEESLLRKVFNLQLNQRAKGDWATTVMKDLKDLRFTESLDDIAKMTENMFKNILNTRIKENALEYLLGKQRSKGKTIKYTSIQMAEYLLPKNMKMTVSQKQNMFSVKNRMLEIAENFPGKQIEDKCWCGQLENILHIYNCEILNEIKPSVKYEELYNGRLQDQISIFERIESNMEKREQIKQTVRDNTPCDPAEIRYLYSNG